MINARFSTRKNRETRLKFLTTFLQHRLTTTLEEWIVGLVNGVIAQLNEWLETGKCAVWPMPACD